MSLAELPGPGTGRSPDLRRRARLTRRLRLVVLACVIAYFFLPYDIRAVIPAWLPFLAAVWLEVQFFVGGYRQGRSGAPAPSSETDRGPQAHDLAELGGEQWRQATVVEIEGERHFVPVEGLSDEEAQERIAEHLGDPDALAAA